MTKVLIIINPSSGDQKGPEVKNELELIYKKKGIQTSTYETTGKDNFKEVIQESIAEGYKKLVLLGGDGTISELVNGIAELEERPKILIIPSGTINNFARTITGDKTPKQLLQAIEKEDLEEIKVDLGRINDKYFISSIAVGLLPAVGWETDDDLKAEFGSFAYFLEGLKLVREEEQGSFSLKIKNNEELLIREDVFLFILGLSNSIFGIQSFFEEASINDGKLHYFGLKKSGIISEASSLIQHILKKEKDQVEDELTFTGSLKNAVIKSDSDLHFLIDGDKGPLFPIKVGVLPEYLTFIVPNN